MNKDLKQRKPITFPVVVFYCHKCGEQLRGKIDHTWFDCNSGELQANFIFKCHKSGIFNSVKGLWGAHHTCIKVGMDGKEISEYSGM